MLTAIPWYDPRPRPDWYGMARAMAYGLESEAGPAAGMYQEDRQGGVVVAPGTGATVVVLSFTIEELSAIVIQGWAVESDSYSNTDFGLRHNRIPLVSGVSWQVSPGLNEPMALDLFCIHAPHRIEVVARATDNNPHNVRARVLARVVPLQKLHELRAAREGA